MLRQERTQFNLQDAQMSSAFLEICRLPPPVWDVTDLQRAKDLFASNMQRAIRDDGLGRVAPPQWSSARGALDCIAGPLSHPCHSLNTRFSYWGFRPTEPQVTQGWAHFLSPRNAGPEAARCRFEAFYRALHLAAGRQVPPPAVRSGTLEIEAEHAVKLPGKQRFIDLLVRWKDLNDRPRALCVEFKFGHQITEGQLSSYRRHVVRNVIGGREGAGGSDFFVVAARSRRSDGKTLKRNAHWSLLYWPAFLRAFESIYLSSEPTPDVDFEQFRRAVWERKNEV